MLVRSNAVDVIVIDSVAALIPRAEIEGEMGDQHMGLQARLMSQAMRKLTGAISKTRTCVIFINQIRMKIGVMFGNPETTPGGNALKFYSSVRIDVRRITTIKEGEKAVGNRVRARVVKNKVAPPFRDGRVRHHVRQRHQLRRATCSTWPSTHGVVEKQGAWFSFGDVRLGQGRENAKEFLADNQDVAKEIRTAVLAKAMPPAPSSP